MGNVNSNEVDNLKKLYSMNNFQLDALRRELIEREEYLLGDHNILCDIKTNKMIVKILIILRIM